MLLLILGSLAALAFAGFLALQPVGEAPAPVSVEAAAAFDQKLGGVIGAQVRSGSPVAFSEEEVNSKLAQTLAGAPAASPLKRLFVRLRPENRVTAVAFGAVMGRPVEGLADLQLSNAEGVTVNIESARIGLLPLPVGLFTEVFLPMMRSAGVALPATSAVPASVRSARIEGTNIIVTPR